MSAVRVQTWVWRHNAALWFQARIQKFFPGGIQLKWEKSYYTHQNTSYFIVILWIDSVWRITVEVHKYENY